MDPLTDYIEREYLRQYAMLSCYLSLYGVLPSMPDDEWADWCAERERQAKEFMGRLPLGLRVQLEEFVIWPEREEL